jgi:hypothetical protein
LLKALLKAKRLDKVGTTRKRLIAGVYALNELTPKLRQSVLLIKDKEASGATAEDAETIATYMSGFARGTNGYNAFVAGAMNAGS